MMLFIILLLSMAPKPPVPQPITPPQVIEQATPKLAWGDKSLVWDELLRSAIEKETWNSDIKSPCKKVPLKECVAQLVSIMAKYESGWKNEVTYEEGFNDSNGRPVISRGLLQLSVESANQKRYSCNVTEKSLHTAAANLACAVRIINVWANQDGYLMAETKKGCARYWSVCRKSSKSNAKIIAYLKEF